MQLILSVAALSLFGQSVEDSLGRVWFLTLLAMGWLIALGAQLLVGAPNGAITLACAGAVAAVLGAHLALHPRAHVHSVLFAPFFSTVLAVPAAALIALWLTLQLPIGLGLDEPLASIGAAWYAHLVALAAGLVAVRALRSQALPRPRPAR